MVQLIALFTIVLVLYILLYSYRTIKNAKQSNALLFNATVKNGNATPEKVFKTIEDAGITINFLGKTK